ncbi:MAG TPA: vWA domain-containing protein [Kofleriaceae bacterium]
MKTIGIVSLAILASCGGAKRATGFASPSPGTSMPAAADSTGAGAVAVGPAAPPSPGATIATDEPGPLPQSGQLTAGVWDDNLNFNFFEAYASRVATSQDLGVFGRDEQRRARELFAQPSKRNELDVQLVVDTTGSMGDELSYLQSELISIANQIRERFPQVKPRWSLVLYKDSGDEYVTRPFDFTTDVVQFQKQLAAQSAGGGGDFPEAVIDGLSRGLQQQWRSDTGVAKVMFWVADAPPHPGEGGKFATVVRSARDRGVHVYPIASSGIDDGTEYQMRAAAQLTGGRYLFLTDDSGVGNSHAEPHIPCYSVTRLDRAVVRMIETELAGRQVATKPADVLRRVGAPDESGTCRVGETQVVAF